jgi:6-pyruvoyltetrahydropterin/6-carboxytetrahydropterin synthase
MYEIKVKVAFSAAHNLKNYHGKCERLHGHNWIVEAVFSFKALGKNGIAMDFKEAKSMLNDVAERLDHTYLNELKLFRKTNPTSEIIAKFIYEELSEKNKNLKSVTVWENENSCATYTGD